MEFTLVSLLAVVISKMLHWVYKRYTTNLFSMPSPTDETEVKTKFYELAHFPGVLGLVDGTHIRIQKPSENEADYVNRHFYHSINVQAICQPDGRFMAIMAIIWKLPLLEDHLRLSSIPHPDESLRKSDNWLQNIIEINFLIIILANIFTNIT